MVNDKDSSVQEPPVRAIGLGRPVLLIGGMPADAMGHGPSPPIDDVHTHGTDVTPKDTHKVSARHTRCATHNQGLGSANTYPTVGLMLDRVTLPPGSLVPLWETPQPPLTHALVSRTRRPIRSSSRPVAHDRATRRALRAWRSCCLCSPAGRAPCLGAARVPLAAHTTPCRARAARR